MKTTIRTSFSLNKTNQHYNNCNSQIFFYSQFTNPYDIETSPLICRTNLYDFYMIDLRFERVKNGYLKKEHRVIYKPLPNIIIEQFCQNSSRLFIFHYFRKKLYLICMTRNKIHIWKKNLTKYLIRMNTKINETRC